MEEESFELLSSMSPKVKHCQRHFRTGTTVLALRRSLQRSSIHDNSLHTRSKDELVLAEISSSTTSTSSTNKSSSLDRKLLNKSPIVIHDSDSDNDLKSHEFCQQTYRTSTVKEAGYFTYQNKIDNIKQWINSVNLEYNATNNSAYSELSTIYGDEDGTNFINEKTGRAVNSTGIGSASIDFEKQFYSKTDIKPKMSTENTSNEEQDVIDESIVEQDNSSNKSSIHISSRKSSNSAFDYKENLNNIDGKTANNEGNIIETVECISDSDDSFSLDKSLTTRLKSKLSNKQEGDVCSKKSNGNEPLKENSFNISDPTNINEAEFALMLDDLYGDKWREKERNILPKTEPRKPKPNNFQVTNSERKPKFSLLYRNPYLESEQLKSNNLLKTLQKSRLKNNAESLRRKQLHDYCDSDTDSNMSDKPKPRIKLNFNDSDCDEQNCEIVDEANNLDAANSQPTTSKYFKNNVSLKKKTLPATQSKNDGESDKENTDEFSFLGQSLEERIQKKINGLEVIRRKDKKEEKTPKNKKGLTKGNCTSSNKIDKKNKRSTKRKEQNTDKRSSSPNNSSSDETWETEISKILHESKLVNGKYSFLASLSADVPILQCDMSARIYRNNFKLYKDELLKKLFELYNENIFENSIPQETVLEWNDRMRGTAGFCYCKKITKRTGAVERKARIVLSTKVIDSANRLRDTLIHEMCHAATWIVNCVSDGHGSYWKSWAYKAMKTFPELPPIKRCHDYVINTKYTYKCTGCGYSIGRHSKSLDIERKRCGYCFGKFEVLLNKVTKKGETKSVPATPKKEATGFALFVKENYSTYKQNNFKHGDVMKLLGQKFQEMKLKQS